MTSINYKVFGLTRPGFEPAGSRLETGGGRSTHLATRTGPCGVRLLSCLPKLIWRDWTSSKSSPRISFSACSKGRGEEEFGVTALLGGL